jgi:putative transcriptional regulator
MTAVTLRARLLVATPMLDDPNFDRTVVLMLEHTDEGALGVVLNRPSETPVEGAVPGWDRFVTDPSVVFVGGPVSRTAVICLARAVGIDAEVWSPVLGPVGTLDLSRDPDEIGTDVQAIRLFAGYAGWDGGQLEDEIASGAWFVVDALPDDALSADPDELWRTVLRRQPGRLAKYANYPADASLN